MLWQLCLSISKLLLELMWRSHMQWQELENLAKEYAQAEANRIYLMEFRKSKKSILMTEAENFEPGMAIAKQERYAYAHSDYAELLKGLQAAVEKSVELKFKIEVFKMRFESWRSKQATSRAEMTLR